MVRLEELRVIAYDLFGRDHVQVEDWRPAGFAVSLPLGGVTLDKIIEFADLAKIPESGLDVWGDNNGSVQLEWSE